MNKKLFYIFLLAFLMLIPDMVFAQEGVIKFANSKVKSLCVSQWDTDGDGELSYDEAAAVTDLGTQFAGTDISSTSLR